MDRLACVDVPALPLQLLLRREPDWRGAPVVVVDRDEPQGRILWVNERARRSRVLPGRRYAEGLSLAAGLRAGVVDRAEIRAAVEELLGALREHSPAVEPAWSEVVARSEASSEARSEAQGEPGVFWLDAAGLCNVAGRDEKVRRGLYASLDDWARQVAAGLTARSLYSVVVVGFDRFRTFALARSGLRGGSRAGGGSTPWLVLRDAREEQRRADRVPLQRLALDPKLRDALDRLGIVDVAGLRKLPPGGLLARFGADADALHELVRGRRKAPLAPREPGEPIEERFDVDPEERALQVDGLRFLIGRSLERMRGELARRGEALRTLHLELRFEQRRGACHRPRCDTLQPAEPTLDMAQVLGLVMLRLESAKLPAAVLGFTVRAEGIGASRQQLELFAEAPSRDLAVANRALARLRAELGDEAVVRAVLRAGHLPEGRFRFEPLPRLESAVVDPEGRPVLVRRILVRPRLLTDQRPGPDGWLPGGLEAGPVVKLHGPLVVSGGWWVRERQRDYHFAELRGGDVLWIYFDRGTRRWYLHGVVE